MNFSDNIYLKQFIEENIAYVETRNYDRLFALAEKQLGTTYQCGRLAALIRELEPDIVYQLSGKLPKGFFHYNNDITSFVVPYNITRIGTGCFQDCKNLESVILHDNLHGIAALAFNNCTAMKEIYIPASVWKIGSGAFSSCKQCVIKCEAESQPETWHPKWNSAHCKVLWGQ